jgi:ketosteroid isomerase-like protein
MRFRIAIVAVCLAVSTFGVAQAKKSGGGSAEPALRAQEDAWLKAFQAHDLNKALAFLAPGAVAMAPNAPPAKTQKELHEAYVPLASADTKINFKADYVAASGDLGVTSGPYQITMMDNGKKVDDKGKYVTVWKKQADGSWKVVRDIFNSDMPAAH